MLGCQQTQSSYLVLDCQTAEAVEEWTSVELRAYSGWRHYLRRGSLLLPHSGATPPPPGGWGSVVVVLHELVVAVAIPLDEVVVADALEVFVGLGSAIAQTGRKWRILGGAPGHLAGWWRRREIGPGWKTHHEGWQWG